MKNILKIAEEAADQVVAATSGKKKKKKGMPSWLLAPAGLGAAAGLGGAHLLASDEHAKNLQEATAGSKAPLGPDETPLTRYTQTMSQLANSTPAGVPIGEALAKARSSAELMRRVGIGDAYAATTPGAFQEARMHYDAFRKGPIPALHHMMQQGARGHTAAPQELMPDRLKGKNFGEALNPHFQDAWKKFVAKKLPGAAGWISPLEIDTKVIPYKEQLEFFKEYENSIPADLKAMRRRVEGDMGESLAGNTRNYMPIAESALKARNIMKNVGITSAGAGVGGLLGHYLHGALADEENPSTLGYLASTLGGAGLGGAASYFGGTEQGRKTMSDAAAKLMSLMQKKSAAAKPGLWANIHAKKERGEAAAKPGDKDYPTAKNWKKVTNESEKKAYDGDITDGLFEYLKMLPHAAAVGAGLGGAKGVITKGPKGLVPDSLDGAARSSGIYTGGVLGSVAGLALSRFLNGGPMADRDKADAFSGMLGAGAGGTLGYIVTDKLLSKKKDKKTEENNKAEKKAGLFYKNLDEPIATVLGDESGEGLASMRTQAPRLLTRLLSNPTTDAQAVLSHLAKHKPESLRPAQRPEDHVSNDYGAALQQLFPSRYRDPRADELFATLGTRLSSEKRPRYKQDVEAMQKNFAPMAHQRYSSPDDKVIVNDLFDRLKEHYPDRKTKTKVTQKSEKKASPAWQTSEGKSESGGLNDKGRASLKAQGHDIKRPQPEGGPRKDSFCARMKGMKSKLTSDETANDPDSRINKALRKWKCGSAQEKWAALATLALSSNAPTLGSVVQGPKAEKGHGIKFQFGTASNPSFLR